MKKIVISENQLKQLSKSLYESDLEYHKVGDASPESNDYEMDEGRRALSRTRKKGLFTKAEIMANPDRFKLQDKKNKRG
jgi:hypothetical protein